MKLVRDNIPDIINSTGEDCKYHYAGEEEFKTYLFEKLREELVEFIEKPSVEEAADMWEAFTEILFVHGIQLENVKNYASFKRYERGGFQARIILEEVHGE